MAARPRRLPWRQRAARTWLEARRRRCVGHAVVASAAPVLRKRLLCLLLLLLEADAATADSWGTQLPARRRGQDDGRCLHRRSQYWHRDSARGSGCPRARSATRWRC